MSVAVARPRTPSPGWALVAATVAVSFSAILIKAAGDDAATIVWLRMGMATVLLAPWVIRDARRGALPHGTRQYALVVVSGVFLAGHFLLWTESLKYTSVAASVLLVSLHPIIVTPLGKRLLGERVSRQMLAGGGLAMAGTIVTCAGDFNSTAQHSVVTSSPSPGDGEEVTTECCAVESKIARAGDDRADHRKPDTCEHLSRNAFSQKAFPEWRHDDRVQ